MKLCLAIDGPSDLKNLVVIFDVLSMREEKLFAALGRAAALAKTKIGRH